MKYGIVGFGVSGILVCLELLNKDIEPSSIHIIDPYFDGGSLGRKWGAIKSNTTWGQIQKVLEKYPTAHIYLNRISKKYESESIIPLYELSEVLRNTIQPFLSEINLHQTKCKKILEVSDNTWQIHLQNEQFLDVDVIFMCQGGKPKMEEFGKPTIPLEVAFDKEQLKKYCLRNQCIGIFGASHSGTLVARNCVEVGCKVILFHKSNPPFLFAKDGAYDGLKQESAEIADCILAKKGLGESIQLVHIEKPIEVIKMMMKCHWLIQCIGFTTREIEIKLKDGSEFQSSVYNAQTGELIENKSIYGFGMAYPGKTTIGEKTYVDISIPSFVEQMEKCLPAVFTKKQ